MEIGQSRHLSHIVDDEVSEHRRNSGHVEMSDRGTEQLLDEECVSGKKKVVAVVGL